MAKSIGNGFPMAAVVTTPEIAKSLQHALHINTFGGNALACAVGSTVLDVSRSIVQRKNAMCNVPRSTILIEPDIRFFSSQRNSSLYCECETTDMKHRAVCLFTPQLWLVRHLLTEGWPG